MTGSDLEAAEAAWAKYEERAVRAIDNTKTGTADLSQQLKDLTAQGVKGMVDSFFEADKSFGEFAKNFLKQIVKMIIQTQILNGLKKSAFAGFLGLARGGAFGSDTGLPWGVYTQPTRFALPGGGPLKQYARGGILGEAGPEAVMPLSRGRDGRLGVESSAPQVNVQVINNAGAQVSTRQEGDTLKVIIDNVRRSLIGDMRRGGTQFSGAIEQTYGLAR
jgi:phage-related minor tail protein